VKAAEGAIEAGTVLVGKYRVESVLGRGGMGMVYRARHLALGEDVAIKILRADVSLDEETVMRFMREAQSAVKLKSEHVARIQDVGTGEDGLPFMVMEFLQGADLGQMVDAHGAMSVPVAVDLVLQACDAIVEAHSLGIVHRDVKPSNLFVSFRPDQSAIVKVLDFGISKSANGSDMSLTQTQSMLGTPAYMSPEQMRSARSVDARTDIWSLGTVLYELVEARRPFEAESFSEMCVMVAVDAPARMINAPAVEPIIARCLAKRPDDRFPHVADLMRELAPYAGNYEAAHHYVRRAYRTLGLGVPAKLEPGARGSYPVMPGPTPSAVHGAASVAMAAAIPPTPMPVVAAQTYGKTLQDPKPPRSSARTWVAVIGIAALLGVGGTIALMRRTDDARSTHGGATSGDGKAGANATAKPGDTATNGGDGKADDTKLGANTAGGKLGPNTADGKLGTNTGDGKLGTNTADGKLGANTADGKLDANTADGKLGANTADGKLGANTADGKLGANTADGKLGDGKLGEVDAGHGSATVARPPVGKPPVGKPSGKPPGVVKPPVVKPPVAKPPGTSPTPPVAKPCGGGDPFSSPRPCKP